MNQDQVIPKGSKVIIEVLENDGTFKTKVINVMFNMKRYIFEKIVSSKHRGYTSYNILSH